MYILFVLMFMTACSFLQAEDSEAIVIGAKLKAPKLKETRASSDLFGEVRKKYAKYKMVEIDASRITTISALDKTKETALKIYVASSGAMRIETKTEPKSITILNDKDAMVIDEPDEFFGGPVRVLISKNPELKNSQAFLRVIFGQLAIENVFTIKKEEKDFVVLSAVNSQFPVQEVRVYFDLKNKLISKIQYSDAQTNKISIKMLNTKFNKSEKTELFNYKIPKDAEITEV